MKYVNYLDDSVLKKGYLLVRFLTFLGITNFSFGRKGGGKNKNENQKKTLEEREVLPFDRDIRVEDGGVVELKSKL